MERLTYHTEFGHVVSYGACSGVSCDSCCDKCGIDKLIDRLAAYEDTGLEPEEVEYSKLALMGKVVAEVEEFDGISIKRLQELAQAEKDGRLVVLPCKLTDAVYVVESIMKGKKHIGEKIVSAQIDHVTIGGSGKPVLDVCTETENWYVALEAGDFWTTREEAEEALKEEADNG